MVKHGPTVDSNRTGPSSFTIEVLPRLNIPKTWNEDSGTSPTSSNDVAKTEVASPEPEVVSPSSVQGTGSETEPSPAVYGVPTYEPEVSGVPESSSVAEAKPPALRRLKVFCFN